MAACASSAFDGIAAKYDAVWTNSAIGRHQRQAVWRHLDTLVRQGDTILDLGCGTGEDAVHFTRLGAKVLGLDASNAMVQAACARGIDARQLAIESLSAIDGHFDGAISNFGALNCVRDLSGLARELGRLIRPGGYLAACLMGPCCGWEIAYYLYRGDAKRAFRRWRRDGDMASIGVRVHYPSVRHVRNAFSPYFRLVRRLGIGLCVPPSYVEAFPDRVIARLAALDGYTANLPLLRSLSDHRLYLFTRS